MSDTVDPDVDGRIEELLAAVPKFNGIGVGDELNDTDVANAARFAREHGADVRWTPERGWLVWDGRRWRPDEIGQIVALAKQTARRIFNELVAAGSSQREAALFKWARQSQSADRIRAMLYLAQSDLAVRFTEFDADPLVLNVANGTLDLRTGELRPHRREDRLSKIADVEFDPDADFKAWDKFLYRVMNNRIDLIAYLQRAAGYSLTASTAGQCLFFCYGHGANGKTVFLETMHRLLGEYAQNASADLVMMRQKGGIPNDVARLAGARLVTINETADGQRLHEPLVKDMTGGDTMTARFLHREFFDFRPSHKLWIRGNHKPQIRGTDDGIWRRIHLIPFTVQIPEAERIPLDELMAILQNEAPGILAWAMRGCLEWQRVHLKPPGAVKEAVRGYREEMDVFGQFMSDCCVLSEGAQSPAKLLYSAYREWCEHAGHEPQSQTRFGLALAERGFTKDRDTPGRIVYQGIGVQAGSESPKGPKGSEGVSKFSPYNARAIEKNPERGSDYSDSSGASGR